MIDWENTHTKPAELPIISNKLIHDNFLNNHTNNKGELKRRSNAFSRCVRGREKDDPANNNILRQFHFARSEIFVYFEIWQTNDTIEALQKCITPLNQSDRQAKLVEKKLDMLTRLMIT
jgi:hypothetical protein